MGFDLHQAVVDNPGKNCSMLFIEFLQGKIDRLERKYQNATVVIAQFNEEIRSLDERLGGAPDARED